MTDQHTPGPWIARMMISGNWTIDEDARGLPIARTLDEANARLIAAAPLMLEALQALTALPPSALLTVLKEAQRDVDEIVDQARAAIRAATGEDA